MSELLQKTQQLAETTVDILGVQYSIVYLTEDEEDRLGGSNGFTDWTEQRIVINKTERGDIANKQRMFRKIVRHEIVHAFLLESGLDYCSLPCDSWATNEEMVEWFARMGERIYKAWKDADACDFSAEEVGE